MEQTNLQKRLTMAMVASMLALVQRMALNLYHFLSKPPILIRKRYVRALIPFG
jgi:hypothetical protein